MGGEDEREVEERREGWEGKTKERWKEERGMGGGEEREVVERRGGWESKRKERWRGREMERGEIGERGEGGERGEEGEEEREVEMGEMRSKEREMKKERDGNVQRLTPTNKCWSQEMTILMTDPLGSPPL